MSACRIYVGNVAYHVTVAEIRGLFKELGPLRDVYAPPPKPGSPPSQLHRGYFFVEYEDARDAGRAIELMHQTADPSGRLMQIREAAERI
jgi:RNA recognition motif-containing protein